MKITIVPYDNRWPQLFKDEQARLKELLAPLSPAVEHIGSTAIPGLSSKPIIDIMVGFRSYDDLVGAVQLMKHPCYVYIRKYEDQMPFRRYFVKVPLTPLDAAPAVIDHGQDIPAEAMNSRTHHIHMVEMNSPFWNDHLLFRNYLRWNNEARLAYQILKEKLSELDWKDGNEYANAKSSFIRSVLEKARHE